jgi:hypothetical protein
MGEIKSDVDEIQRQGKDRAWPQGQEVKSAGAGPLQALMSQEDKWLTLTLTLG